MLKMKKQEMRNFINGIAFILPNFIGFMVFILIPVLVSFGLSFTDWDGFTKANFVGFENYIKMFSSKSFIISLKNTVFYTVVFVPATLALSLVVAAALNTGVKGIKFFRTAFFCLICQHLLLLLWFGSSCITQPWVRLISS